MDVCYRTANNKYFTAPPRMADGRFFTDYRPNYKLNNMILKDNNVENSFDYRMFLTQNAEKIMELNWRHAYIKNGVFKCKSPYQTGTMLPEVDRIQCNAQTCNIVSNDENGLGRGRSYGENNELLRPMDGPELVLNGNRCTPPRDAYNYLGNNNVQRPTRQAVQGGGVPLSGGDASEYQ